MRSAELHATISFGPTAEATITGGGREGGREGGRKGWHEQIEGAYMHISLKGWHEQIEEAYMHISLPPSLFPSPLPSLCTWYR